MTYNVFSGTLNPTYFTSPPPTNLTSSRLNATNHTYNSKTIISVPKLDNYLTYTRLSMAPLKYNLRS